MTEGTLADAQQPIVVTSTPQVLGLTVTATPAASLALSVVKPSNLITTAQSSQEPTVAVVYKQNNNPFAFAKFKVNYNPSGILSTLKFIFWTTIYTIWPDLTALLVLLLLLLITLDISLRDHRKQQYKHDQQYMYKPLLPNTYKA